MELSSISLSILQWRGTRSFTTKLPQKQTWTLWWWTPWILQYQRRRRWESEWRMLKTPGKRHVLISLNKNKFPFILLFLLYTSSIFILNFSCINTNIPLSLLLIWPSRRTVSQIPYPPPILTEHHTWYIIPSPIPKDKLCKELACLTKWSIGNVNTGDDYIGKMMRL